MMKTWCVLSLLASLAALLQAIPQEAVLEETIADLVEVGKAKRSEGRRQYTLHAFGKQIDLDLVRTEDLLPQNLPVYVYGEDDEGNTLIDDWTHRTDTDQRLYTDRNTGASLMVDELGEETKLRGMLGGDLIIEPVEDIELTEDEEEGVVKREMRHIHHVVYKVKQQEEDSTRSDYVEADGDKASDDGREKRAVPEKVYIPVHVVVDYKLYKKLDRTESEVISYIKIFYNSVNMIYSQLSWPSVSVSIQGITICKYASACSMVESARLGSDGVNSKTALDAIAKYAYSQKSLTGEDYALLMVMTDYDLCSVSSSGVCERSNAGLAYVATVCDTYRFSKTSKTGIAEDHGVFDGVKTVSHEMGHILGMKHDGDGPARSGAPGATSCRWSDNYLMGETAFVLNQFKWSSCSVSQLRWMVVQSSASCVLRPPSRTGWPLLNKLPGKVVDLDNQCKVLYGPTSGIGCREPGINSGNDQLCLGLMCKVGGSSCQSKTAAAEGSYCGPQRYCREGRCICDPSAPLPTAPPRDPNCNGDNPRILINGKSCVDLLSSPDGLSNCNGNLVKTYCCESRVRYCRATPISCDGSDIPSTPKPTRPSNIFVPPTTTTRRPYVPPSDVNCGKTCQDTPFMRINGQSCSTLLGSTSGKTNYCDNPTIVEHCCATRAQVCAGYHWITPSCTPSCQDNPSMRINGQRCVPFLSTTTNRENFCDSDITVRNCCATRSKVCGSSAFGK